MQSLKNILTIRLKEIDERLADRRINLSLSSEAKDKLCELGYDPVYGARPLNRVLQKKVLNPLSKLMIKGQIREGETILVDLKEDEIYVTPNHEEEIL